MTSVTPGRGSGTKETVDDGDEEEADEAEVEEEVHEAVMGSGMGLGEGQAEGEEGCEREGARTHAGVMTVARMGETRGNFLGAGVEMFVARWFGETWREWRLYAARQRAGRFLVCGRSTWRRRL